jgi:3-oxoacyl-[acyl-carrier-protein] synthase-3
MSLNTRGVTDDAPAPSSKPSRPGLGVSIASYGHYLPEDTVTNDDLSRIVDTNDSWIFPRTGIRSRHRADANQATSDLASIAGARALESGGFSAADLDLIIVATATPDSPVPSCAVLVQSKLQAWNAAAMDVSAACAGFVYASHVAAGLIRAKFNRRVLVVGAETLTRITDYTDRSTCILFGDAAGAAIFEDGSSGGSLELLYSDIASDGRYADLIHVPAGGSRLPSSEETVKARQGFLRLRGQEVYKLAVTNMVSAARKALDHLNMTIDDIRWVIPHQANARILKTVADQLGVHPDRAVDDIATVGNTSAASLPVAMSRLRAKGGPNVGDRIMLLTFGAGATWGAQVYECT